MAEPDPERTLDQRKRFMRLFGSAPWGKLRERTHHRSKIFKSGNSLAFRIPTGTKLEVGMEMEMTIEDGEYLSLEPVERPKRKFNIAKVAGSATSLDFVNDEDRLFEERPLLNGGGDVGNTAA